MKTEVRGRIDIHGLVQGVGLRPYLHRLALQTGVKGWARNTSGGLEAELEGTGEQLELFISALKNSPPPLSEIENISFYPLEGKADYSDFRILESRISPEATLAAPDTAPCPACEKELFTPGNRRYRYPFINCTDCGPRYTIIRELPYDRKHTVMDRFPMCSPCGREYTDIGDRRYHAQPDCCPECGPSVYFLDEQFSRQEGDPFALAQKLLSDGKILAVKGTGGIHLACDAGNPHAVRKLRQRKQRPARPLALMCRSLEEASGICLFTDEEASLLTSPRRPIVLLRKRSPQSFTDISFSRRLGVMLPYTPLHLLLLDGKYNGPGILVMTSANPGGCPVLIGEDDAFSALTGIADGYLFHNRPIENRCDDSLLTLAAGRPYFFRRSRGYVPQPLPAGEDVTGICSLGAEQKASFALGRDRHIFLSPHIGDLKNAETLDHYRETLKTYLRLFKISPSGLVCDLHPDYFSTLEARSMAREFGIPLLQVQHHWAHMAACREDNHLEGKVFGIIWDGTGLGTDGTIWGGEFLTGDNRHFQRTGSIRPILLPGGDQAVREISRISISLLYDAGLPSSYAPMPPETARMAKALLASGTACTGASSIGRLFDGICSLICRKSRITYDGEAAALLESLPTRETPCPDDLKGSSPWPLVFYEEDGLRRFDTRPLVRAAVQELDAGRPADEIARHFMLTLCYMALDQCRSLNTEHLPVVLSGGVFLNRFLLEGIRTLLGEAGFQVFCHKNVSACDEGICLGQLSIAGAVRNES